MHNPVTNNVKKYTHSSIYECFNIPVGIYPDSKKRIYQYFGKDNLMILFRNSTLYPFWKDYKKQFGLRRDGAYSGEEDDNSYFYRFIASLGACLKFDINESLKKVIEKYWSKTCDDELKKFYSKYGFFSSNVFRKLRLKEILGKEKLFYFYEELEAKARTFKIKWCGFEWDDIKSYHIPWDYAQYLRFKWKIKPEIYIKKCVYCGNDFMPYFFASDEYPYSSAFSKIDKFYPIKESIKEINFCPKCFPPDCNKNIMTRLMTETRAQETWQIYQKKMKNIAGVDLPKKFYLNLNYLEGLTKEKFENSIKIINDLLLLIPRNAYLEALNRPVDIINIKNYINERGLYELKKNNYKDPSYQLGKKIVSYTCFLYNKYGGSLKEISQIIKVSQSKLKHFFIQAGTLGLVDYENLRPKSKYHLFTYRFNSFKEQGEEFKKDFSEQVEKALRKYGDISKVEKSLEISRRDFLIFSDYKYGSSRISEIKRIFGLGRPLELKKDERQRILKVRKLYDECKTLKETGQKLGITKARVWQILKEGEKLGLFNLH